MIKAIIIEDEDFAVARLKMLLRELDNEVEIIAEMSSTKQAVKWLSSEQADLIFLDINLSDGNAFKIFEQVTVQTPVIFTTAYHEYALRAFEQFSIDYLLKPVSREKLKNSLTKFKTLKSLGKKNDQSALETLIRNLQEKSAPKRFMVNIGSKVKIIEEAEIAYFSFDSKITFIHTHEGKRFPIDSSLKQLELSMSRQNYFRVNRQYLLGRQSIRELQYFSPTRIKIHLTPEPQEDLFVARDKIGIFKKWLVG